MILFAALEMFSGNTSGFSRITFLGCQLPNFWWVVPLQTAFFSSSRKDLWENWHHLVLLAHTIMRKDLWEKMMRLHLYSSSNEAVKMAQNILEKFCEKNFCHTYRINEPHKPIYGDAEKSFKRKNYLLFWEISLYLLIARSTWEKKLPRRRVYATTAAATMAAYYDVANHHTLHWLTFLIILFVFLSDNFSRWFLQAA